MHTRRWTLSLCLLSIFVSMTPAYGGDISADISRGQYTGDGGFLEIGAFLFAGNSALVGVPKKGETATGGAIGLTGRWQKGPAFIEAGAMDSINLGLSVWNNEHWWVDAMISQRHKGLDPDDIDALKNSNLEKREADLPIGLRATGYLGNTLVQITVLSGDLRDKHDGYTLAAELGHYWQIRNYNLHWLLGAIYESDNVTHYYFGVDSDQADANFPAYNADASYRLFAEMGLTLALTEHWVVRGQARYGRLSNAIENSPIIEDNYTTLAAVSLSYVF